MFTTTDNFDKDSYIRSQKNQNIFINKFNSLYLNYKATNLDEVDRFKADILLSKNGKPFKYIELQTNRNHYSIFYFWERRLNKTYDLPVLFIYHELTTDDFYSKSLSKIYEDIRNELFNSHTSEGSRFANGRYWDETYYEIPATYFDKKTFPKEAL